MTGWCFVCERDGVVLEEFRQHDGHLAKACADQRACLSAYARLPPRKLRRAPKATR